MLLPGAAGFGLMCCLQVHQPELAAAACTPVPKAIGSWHTSRETSNSDWVHEDNTPRVLTKLRPYGQSVTNGLRKTILWPSAGAFLTASQSRTVAGGQTPPGLVEPAEPARLLSKRQAAHKCLLHHRGKVALCTCNLISC